MKARTLIAAAVLSSIAGVASAADQADVRVAATVINNCKIISTEDINFGRLDPAVAADQKAGGKVAFACTRNVEYTLAANEGANFDKAANKRRMKGSDDTFLPYGLDQASFTGKGQGFSSPIKVDLLATLAGSDYRDLPAGDYIDTLRVTLTP